MLSNKPDAWKRRPVAWDLSFGLFPPQDLSSNLKALEAAPHRDLVGLTLLRIPEQPPILRAQVTENLAWKLLIYFTLDFANQNEDFLHYLEILCLSREVHSKGNY